MPATTPDSLRWPLDTDTPDVPRDMGLLAADVQAALGRLVKKTGDTMSGNLAMAGSGIGVYFPDQDVEVFTHPNVPGELLVMDSAGTVFKRVNVGAPITDSNAVNKGYINGGYAQFGLTATIANAQASVIAASIPPGYGTLGAAGDGKIVITRSGYYLMSARLSFSPVSVGANQRWFLELVHDATNLVGARASYGFGEDTLTVTAMLHLAAPTNVWVQAMQSSGSTRACTGNGAIRYLGAHD